MPIKRMHYKPLLWCQALQSICVCNLCLLISHLKNLVNFIFYKWPSSDNSLNCYIRPENHWCFVHLVFCVNNGANLTTPYLSTKAKIISSCQTATKEWSKSVKLIKKIKLIIHYWRRRSWFYNSYLNIRNRRDEFLIFAWSKAAGLKVKTLIKTVYTIIIYYNCPEIILINLNISKQL